MELSLELSKPEYQTGTYAKRLTLLHSKTESAIGKIAYGNTLHLVSMLVRGLRARIELQYQDGRLALTLTQSLPDPSLNSIGGEK